MEIKPIIKENRENPRDEKLTLREWWRRKPKRREAS
jgi:hypothetical protein